LWLGPVPDRPYHPNYTHNVFRGWYDFGGGSIADMGHYSLFPLFLTFGIETPPISAEAYGTTTRTIVDNVSQAVNNNVAFPYSCMIRFKFPKPPRLLSQTAAGAFDLFWYDGGMKPFAPEELDEDGKSLSAEGMMFVGDKGKILAGFHGEQPQIIPAKKMQAYAGPKEVQGEGRQRRSTTWVESIKNKEESPGSFLLAGPVTETINLGAVALRAGRRVDYDATGSKVTNFQQANKYLTREYRKGWEL
jgi:hypothetical protein